MAHTLTARDKWFLQMKRRDPLTSNTFREGDRVVVCRKCRCVQYAESWELNQNSCCMGLCTSTSCTDQFSRAFIDLNYRPNNDFQSPKFTVLRSRSDAGAPSKYKASTRSSRSRPPRLRQWRRRFVGLNLFVLALFVVFALLTGPAGVLPECREVLTELISAGAAKLSLLPQRLAALLLSAQTWQSISDKLAAMVLDLFSFLGRIPDKVAALSIGSRLSALLKDLQDWFTAVFPHFT